MDARADNPRAVIGGNQPPTFKESMAEKYGSVFAALEPLADMADEAPEKITGPDELAKVSDIVRGARKLFNEVEEIRTREKQPFLDGGKEVDGFFGAKKEAIKRVVDAMQKRADAYQAEVDRLARAKALAEARAAEAEAKRQSDLAAAEAARNRPVAAAKHEEKAVEAEKAAEKIAETIHASVADLTRLRTEGGTTSATTKWTFEITDYSKVDLNQIRAYIPRERVEMGIQGYVNVHKDKGHLSGVVIKPVVKARIT